MFFCLFKDKIEKFSLKRITKLFFQKYNISMNLVFRMGTWTLNRFGESRTPFRDKKGPTKKISFSYDYVFKKIYIFLFATVSGEVNVNVMVS